MPCINYPEEEKTTILRLSISRITFLKFEEKKFLCNYIDNPYTLALLSIEEIEKLVHRSFSKKVIWDGSKNLEAAVKAFLYCQRMGIQILFYDSDLYPELLANISDPPFVLYCRGDAGILKGNNVSVVGTRRLTYEGKLAAKTFAYDAVLHGVNVVSGLANGADGFAHRGSVDAYYDFLDKKIENQPEGKTIAVLPGSIDNIIPAGNKKLAEKILASGGCLISEYEPALQMEVWHYVARNRIIAGLSRAVVVVQAPAGSGALITADFALDYGRDVFFHEATFCESAVKLAEKSDNDLSVLHAAGKASKYKLENTPKKFLDAGAPVIKDFADYCTALTELPGTRLFDDKNKDYFQKELF